MNWQQRAGNDDQFRWCQAPDGTWQRDIDEAERFYATFCRKPDDPDAASFAVTCHASFFVPVSETGGTYEATNEKITDALRTAWLALCHESPTLASWIQYDPSEGVWKRMYAPLNGSEDSPTVSAWLSQTFKQVNSDTNNEWFNMNPPVFKVATLFVVASPSDQDDLVHRKVYLRCPHDLVDGIGILHLIHRFFELADRSCQGGALNTRWDGHEVAYLSPPLSTAIGIRGRPTDAQRQAFDALVARNATLQTEKPLLGFTLSDDSGGADRIQRLSFSLSENLTAELVRRSKLHGITITHLVSAALTLALRDLQSFPPGTLGVKYCNQSIVNLRGLCLPSQDPLAVGNYHMVAAQSMAIDLSLASCDNATKGSEEELIAVAKQFRDYYAAIRPVSKPIDQDLLSFIPMTWDMFTPKPTTQPLPQQQVASVAISSLGNISSIVKTDYGAFSLKTVWVAGETLGTGISTFIQTFAGELGFSTIFNLGFHQEERIEALQELVLKKLTELSQ
ncbi:unnamed protein product [Clonostachys byssicola]|uniref:Phthiocerol/phthiodiolone dimycocerosyl transferase C-terminal domain-containing protein n=1 Tax=Clonostachys byssicola TaxID=160290 RepID=A0A9N9U4X8_9HYPO|nr:unnamed protein product [Clonostachys byssicola]